MKDVFIVSYSRTPIGSFGGMLSDFSATDLGGMSIKAALEGANINKDDVTEVYFGNVVSSNLGQAPARQAAIKAGLNVNTITTTVNKVCASGMKSIALAAQSIQLGLNDVIVAGGMESMSNIPFYVPQMRWGNKFGDSKIIDGLAKDGLLDVYNQTAMGCFADATSEKYGISRDEQDEFAIQSYKKAAKATIESKFKKEIGSILIPQKKGDAILMDEDEEFKNVNFDKIASLRPAFTSNGTVTAANASTINDGAATMILASEGYVKKNGLTPLARIISFADAEQSPEWFTTSPVIAAPLALKKAGLNIQDIDFFEVNEAFSVVALSFIKLLDIDPSKVNVYGGAVSLGHPLGCSGARIAVTLQSVLSQENGKYGAAVICNGGGGASAMIFERF